MKPRVAFFDFASCEGCQLQVINLEESILDLIDAVDIVSFRETMKEHSDEYDIAFIEGSIVRPMDEERLKKIRANAKFLIALGDCACTGGVNKLRNLLPVDEVVEKAYGDVYDNDYFEVEPAKAIDEVVDVDFYIRGCPIRKDQLLYYVNRFATTPPHKNLDMRFDVVPKEGEVDARSIIQYNPKKCILCRRCHVVCNEVLNVHTIGISQKGNRSIISTPFGVGLEGNKCIFCGQCLVSCPVGAFSEKSDVNKVSAMLKDPSNFVVFVVDPIAITSFIETIPGGDRDMGAEIGKIITALKEMNAKRVMDFTPYTYLSYAAQGEYIRDNRTMTFSSWCPSVQEYLEKFYPEYQRYTHPETSPANFLLKTIKSKYPEENLKIVLVSPCIAYKTSDAFDGVLTSRELSALFKSNEIDLDLYSCKKVDFDKDIEMERTYIRGVRSDYSYARLILEIAYMSKFHNLDVTLNVTPIEDYVYEFAFDSEEGFFSALLIEDMSKLRKYLSKGIEKYNLVEFYPCLHGCISGGGQVLTNSLETIDKRIAMLKEYKGVTDLKNDFISQVIKAYSQLKEVI